jgi:uncharacterized membrane protein
MNNPSHDQVVTHFYRAVVAHMDVWRQRMDATTNWAAVTMAAMISFAFGSVTAPHFVLLLAVTFDMVFLLMESRRYQIFDLWRRRFRTLNHYVIVPALRDDLAGESDERVEQLRNLADGLGGTVPELTLAQAVGYRIRRNHGYLLLVGLLAWVLKLDAHPVRSSTWLELVDRARVANCPGAVVLILVGAFAILAIVLAVQAPSERMLQWTSVASPIRRPWTRR